MSTEDNRDFGMFPAIDHIDETVALRSDQIGDQDVTSYTLGLLRDPNKAGKKFGEEAAEVMMAVCGEDSIEAVEGEIADLIYAGLVLAHSRGKTVRLGNVLGILIARNEGKPQKISCIVARTRNI